MIACACGAKPGQPCNRAWHEHTAARRMASAKSRWQAMRLGMLDDQLRWFWLSFADGKRPKGQQWLGASVVQGVDFPTAVVESHAQGCNPGGEVQGTEFRLGFEPPAEFTNRLLTMNEARAFDRAIGGDGTIVNPAGERVE